MQVGITDALDAFLPEGVVVGSTNSTGSRPFDRDNDSIAGGDDDDDDIGVLVPRGGSAVGIGGRRGGWGSSSDSDGCDRFATRTTRELNDDDSASNATVKGDISSSMAHRTNRVPSSLSLAAPTSASASQKSAAAAAKERQKQPPRDRLEQMIETTVGGAIGQWPKRRPSKTTSRTRQHPLCQPQQPSRRRAQPDTTGLSLRGEDILVDFSSAATTAAGTVASAATTEHCISQMVPGDHDDDSIEDGLIVSSVFPSKFSGGGDDGRAPVGRGGGVRGGAGVTAASSCVRPPARQTTSMNVAPFHGPVTASLAFGSGSDALPMVPATDETSSIVDGRTSGSRDEKGRSSDDLTAVRGISVRQHAASKDGNHNPHNQPSPTNGERTGCGDVATTNSATVFPMSTWGGSGGRGAVFGSDIDNSFRIEGEASNASALFTGKTGGVIYISSSGGAGENRTDRAEGISYNHPPEPRRAPRPKPPAPAGAGAAGAVNKDHHAQPPHPLKHCLTSAETAAQQQPSSSKSLTSHSMGISGTGVALPWRSNSRRQAPTTTTSLSSTSGGTNRRRSRHEQNRTSAVGEGGGTVALDWGTDGGHTTTSTKGGGGNVGDSTSTNVTSLVIPNRWGDRLHGAGGGGGGGGGASGGTVESEPRSGGAGDVKRGAVEDPEGMVLVASAVAAWGGGGSGAGRGGGSGARSGTTKGWRAAGDSLANLNARMGVRYQQNLPGAAAAASGSPLAAVGEVVGGKRNANESMAKDRGLPHHIPSQTF